MSGVSTSGTGTAADPYISTWVSGGETHRIAHGAGTTPNNPNVRARHDEDLDSWLAAFPPD